MLAPMPVVGVEDTVMLTLLLLFGEEGTVMLAHMSVFG